MLTEDSAVPDARQSFRASLLIMALRGLSAIAKLILALFITKFIGLKGLGVYGLIVGITSLGPVVLGLGLMNSLSRAAVTQTESQTRVTLRYYRNTLIVIHSLVFLVAAAFGESVGALQLWLTIFAVNFAEHANGDLFGLLINIRKPILANILFFVRAGAWIYAYVALAYFSSAFRNIEWVLLAWVLGGVAAFVLFAGATRLWSWGIRRTEAQQEELRHTKWLAKELHASRLLYLNDVANSITQYGDRYLVTVFAGLETAGIYVFYLSIGNVLSNLVRNSVVAFMRPHMIASFRNNTGQFLPIFRRFTLDTFVSSGVLAALAFGATSFGLPYFHEPRLSAGLPVFGLILAAFIGRMIYEAQGGAFYSQHRDDLTLVTGILVLVATLLLNLCLVPILGAMGAGWAGMIAVLIGCLARWQFMNKLSWTSR
jgi:O-antigen/teichoic acid export membrane protein